MPKKMAMVGMVMLVCACAEGRYEMEAANNMVWRLNTLTGALDACGWEKGTPICTAFPAAKR
jgi:hypothetical protein